METSGREVLRLVKRKRMGRLKIWFPKLLMHEKGSTKEKCKKEKEFLKVVRQGGKEVIPRKGKKVR